MLQVLTREAADKLLAERFPQKTTDERVALSMAAGRVLRADILAEEDLPGFTRSSVDGYALRAGDSFGCSESIPALLLLSGRVEMGAPPPCAVEPDCCCYVPTGGALPEGADAVVMLEHTEAFGAYIGVVKPVAPGENLVLRGDDAKRGRRVLPKGRVLRASDIGALAALGRHELCVAGKPRVTVLSTGNEVVSVETPPLAAQVRDVNGPMLAAQAATYGAEARSLGIVPDEEGQLSEALLKAARGADLVLLSGGSSVGEKDAVARVIGALGALLFHGLALKPGKPTLAGEIGGVPVIGLPGHPMAAYMVCHELVRGMIARMLGAELPEWTRRARLTENVSANHGREALVPVRLRGEACEPLMLKSGLITALGGSDGYIRIPRDCEGRGRDEEVLVYLWGRI